MEDRNRRKNISILIPTRVVRYLPDFCEKRKTGEYGRDGIMRHLTQSTLLLGVICFCLVNGVFGQSKNDEAVVGADAVYEQGQELMRRGEYRKAQALLEKALRADPADPRLYELLGDAYWRLRDSYLAIEAYTEALKRDPRRFSAYEKRAGIHSEREEWVDSVADLDKAIQLRPDVPRNYLRRGLIHRELNQFAKARADFERAYEQGCAGPAAYCLGLLLATCSDAAVRDGSRAIKYAQEACKQTDFKDYRSLSALAAAYAEAGQWDEAVRRSKVALEFAEGEDRTRQRTYCELYQFHEPLRGFAPELVANKQPSSAGEALLFARGKIRSGDCAGALADLRKAVELNPRLSSAHFELAMLTPLQNPSESIDHLTRAIELNPENVYAFAARSFVYFRQGRYREALKNSEAALLLDPKLRLARLLHVIALASLGEADKALAELARFSEAFPREPYLKCVWGHCYLMQGRYTEAVAELTEALRRYACAWAYSDRAVALSALGKEKEAKEDLEACNRLDPVLRARAEERMKEAKEKRSQHDAGLEESERKEK
jgi:tetratricopeptide (TPR) repeat protein